MAKSLIDEKWNGLARPVCWLRTIFMNLFVSFSMNGEYFLVNSLLSANDRECSSHGSESTANLGKSNGLLFGVIVVVTLLCFEKMFNA